jgi:hypothetical protein
VGLCGILEMPHLEIRRAQPQPGAGIAWMLGEVSTQGGYSFWMVAAEMRLACYRELGRGLAGERHEQHE